MLAPETIDLLPPRLTEKKGKLGKITDSIGQNGNYRFHKEDCHEAVEVTSMKIVMPGIIHAPEELQEAFHRDTVFYKARNVESIFNLILTRDFAQTFVAQGRLFLQSEVEDHTRDDSLIILPNGRLTLSTDLAMSQRLGLDGFKVHHIGKERVVAMLDLHSLIEGGTSEKTIDKWKSNLHQFQGRLTMPFTFSWNPHDVNVCPSTLAKYFYDHGASIEAEEPTIILKRREVFSNQIPSFGDFDDDSAMYDERDYDIDSVEDWVGGLLFGAKRDQMDELSRRCSIEEDLECGNDKQKVLIIEVQGLFLADALSEILMVVEKSVKSIASIPWAIVTLQPSWPKLHLLQAKKKVKVLSMSSRTLLVTPKFTISRSKRG